MNILENVWRNSSADRDWKPCDICGDPIREGKLCGYCREAIFRLGGFMVCQNGVDFVYRVLGENKIAPRNKSVDGCVHTRPILISTQPTHFVPNGQPYNDSNDYITIEPFDTYDVWLSGQYCLECGTLLNIEIDD